MNFAGSTKLNRFRSALRYLNWAEPIYKWKFCRGLCPACHGEFFISLAKSDFMTRCLHCRANIANIALIPVIEKHFLNSSKNAHAYELSTYGSTLKYLQENFGQVTTSEYMPDKVLGSLVNGVLNQDIQKLTFDNETFDLITSNAVLEHVPDDIMGFAECHRVLKQDGAMIMSVPLYDTPATVKMVELTSEGVTFLQEPEYHDSRLGGPKSALTFWRHSFNDICARVKSVGFSDVNIVDVMIAPSQGLPTKILYAVK
jgi:SAM-dependent methyltransferase